MTALSAIGLVARLFDGAAAPPRNPGQGDWDVPTDAELDASLPSVDAARAARDDVAVTRARRVYVVLPQDPAARVAAQRLVDQLERMLPPGAVQVAAAADAARLDGDAAVIDLRGVRGANPLGRFGLPDAASHAWSIASSAGPAGATTVRVEAAGLWGAQLAVTRLLELAGVSFASYNHVAAPRGERVAVPASGARLSGGSSERFAYRAMAPHTYHPIELSIALHDPSPRSAQVLRRYVDWSVATGQNVIQFPLLDVEAGNVVTKLDGHPQRRAAWDAHVREFAAYARERGVQLAANVSFTVFTAAHLQAMGFVGATIDTFRLNRRQSAWLRAPEGSEAADQARRAYEQLLDATSRRHEAKVAPLVQRLAGLGFDEVHFNLGTSEFTAPNDDLQLAWMHMAQRAAEAHGMRATVGSHVPKDPVSPRHGVPMFDLHLKADAAVGAHIHTVQVPALTDRAQTYGIDSFRHKLETLDQATPERLETWYPETSYWVQYDVTVPLFLPVYMLARHRDHRRLLANERLDGQMTFTTAWEWGYWLNDAAMARMTTDPDASLTRILLDVLSPLGAVRDETVSLLRDVMRTQQRYLVDGALLRHLQGFDALSTLGETLGKVPLLNKVVHASNNVPVRTGWSQLRRMTRAQVDEFAATDLVQLRELLAVQQREVARVRELRTRASGTDAAAILDELVDGLEVNALRTRQVLAALEAMVYARRTQLGEAGLRDAMAAALQVVAATKADATVVVRRREAAYRESPDDAYLGDRLSSGAQGTMWKGRSLTPVHTLKYWTATLEEAAKAVRST